MTQKELTGYERLKGSRLPIRLKQSNGPSGSLKGDTRPRHWVETTKLIAFNPTTGLPVFDVYRRLVRRPYTGEEIRALNKLTPEQVEEFNRRWPPKAMQGDTQ